MAAAVDATRNGDDNILALMISPATPRLVRAVAEFKGGYPIHPEDIRWEITYEIADLIVRTV